MKREFLRTRSMPTTRDLELGILDIGFRVPGHSALYPFGASVSLAQAAEGLGYTRFWVAEHHGTGSAHRAPEILVGAIASATSTIRVGTGGVLLRYRNPYQTAQSFRLLAALYPSRIELGIARGAVPPRLRRLAAPHLRSKGAEIAALDRNVRQLVSLMRSGSKEDLVVPAADGPDCWMLGSNRGARVGADCGIHCALDLVYNPLVPELLRATVKMFRERAAPTQKLALGICGICSRSDRQAREYSDRFFRNPSGYRPTIVGSPERCRDKIEEMRSTYGISSFILLDLQGFGELRDRCRAYRMLARGCGI